jgi:hypothetical protein
MFSTTDFTYNNLFLQYNRKTKRGLCDIVRIRQHLVHVKKIRTAMNLLHLNEYVDLITRSRGE